MSKVSVVTISKDKNGLDIVKKRLEKQKFKDFEFVGSTKGNIPESWNDAIDRSRGEIIVFTETDAVPLSENWLGELVKNLEKYNKNDPEKKTIVKGLEVRSNMWDLCNTACYSEVFKKIKFNENFERVEDTEFFTRLKNHNYKGVQLTCAPVLHWKETKFLTRIKNEFKGSYYRVMVLLKYGHTGFESLEFSSNSKNKILSAFYRELTNIFCGISHILGAFFGFISYHLGVGKKLWED